MSETFSDFIHDAIDLRSFEGRFSGWSWVRSKAFDYGFPRWLG
jgi:hypothetical protein